MKDALGLSNRKTRLMCKALKKIGATVASEKSQRCIAKAIHKDYVVVESKLFSEDEKHRKLIEAPFARIRNLPTFVTQLLDQYDETDMLTWHNGAILEGDILIKIGGGTMVNIA